MRFRPLIALLLLAAIGAAMGCGSGGFGGSEPGSRTAIPNLAKESPFRLGIDEAQGPGLPLKIEGINDRSVVEGPATCLYGSTLPDAFVTVNGQVVAITDNGLFYTDVDLEPGTNYVVVVASDFNGRQTTSQFTVVSLQ